MHAFILALDQGTTSSRAIVFDPAGVVRASAQREFPQIYPQSGWVEHDPVQIWRTQIATAREALARAGLKPEQIAGVGIANQRETTVVWDRQTGAPVHNAIVWQDRRTARDCEELKRTGLADRIQERTGLVVDAYFSGTKLRWILDRVPGARQRARRGELAFGTIDTWLLWKIRDEVRHTWQADRTFEPRMSGDEAAHRRRRWLEALRRAKEWEEVHPQDPAQTPPASTSPHS